ncbi:MAG: hypothetical protein MR663_07915 [Lachnospiraceae bacterium]|nr:hypothetical protein [Lachnospiraceae bacterium]
MEELKKVCIYHFTNAENLRRPIVNEKQMAILNEFASQYGDIKQVYLDGTLKQCNQDKKKQMIKEIANYDILVMKDFYHLARNTGACFGLLQAFSLQGVKTITMEDGSFSFQFQDAPFDKKLKICVYHSKYKEDGDRTIETQINIFKTFVSHKTNWKIVDVFVDEANSQSDSVQTEIFKVIENAKQGKYDLLLIKDFNTFHWRTAKFCHRRNELQLPMYSLKEGYLLYEKESDFYEI